MTKENAINLINGNTQIEEKVEGYMYLANEEKNTSAMLILGDYYFSRGDIELSIAYFKKAIEHKNPKGYTRLGFMYYYGKGVKKDYEEAFKYFSRGALEGDTTSILKLSDMYKFGYSVEKNYGTSVNIIDPLFQKGMKELLKENYINNPIFEVSIRFADLFKDGLHFKKNLRKALNYYILAYAGFSMQKNSKDIENKKAYCLKNIEELKKIIPDLTSKYELLDFAFDKDFNFDYKVSETSVDLYFNFINKELFIDIDNLSFRVLKQVIAHFDETEKYNQVDYEVLRPNDYRIEKSKMRLYDDESTLMHFEFKNITLSAN